MKRTYGSRIILRSRYESFRFLVAIVPTLNTYIDVSFLQHPFFETITITPEQVVYRSTYP